jgi:DNA-binding NarL/FixJ family response regulator
MTVRVHLADDHTMFREGLQALLSSREGVQVVGNSPTGPEAAARVRESRPDVVVTELDMQPRDAEEVISALRETSPNSRIVVLTLWDNLRYLRAVAGMGIDALMHKSSTAEELLATIGTVSRDPGGGNAVISMPRGLLQRPGGEPAVGLSKREAEVVVLAARGLSNRLIAQKLHLSEGTVKRHLANVYEKVGVHSRTAVVRRALVEQWIGIHEIISSADGNAPRTATTANGGSGCSRAICPTGRSGTIGGSWKAERSGSASGPPAATCASPTPSR